MSEPKDYDAAIDRRAFLAATTGVAALAAGCSSMGAQDKAPVAGKRPAGDVPTAPFDSIRDYMAALEASGLVVRIPE